MGLGSRLRKTFSRNNKSSSSITPPSSPETYSTARTDIEYYKPHEIPKSKYKGKVDPVHKERLESYSFADAFGSLRRSSVALSGTFSPGGTKARSAAASAVQSRRPSWVSHRGSSETTGDGEGDGLVAGRRKSVAAQGAPVESPLTEEVASEEGSTEDTMVNTETASKHDLRPDYDLPELRLQNTVGATKPQIDLDLPFSPEELERAMTRATVTSGSRRSLMSVGTTVPV